MICPKCNTQAEYKEYTTFNYWYCPNCKEEIYSNYIEIKTIQQDSYKICQPFDEIYFDIDSQKFFFNQKELINTHEQAKTINIPMTGIYTIRYGIKYYQNNLDCVQIMDWIRKFDKDEVLNNVISYARIGF